MKHYALVEFLPSLNVKPPLHERKAPRINVKHPYWRLSGDGSALTAKNAAKFAVHCTETRRGSCARSAELALTHSWKEGVACTLVFAV